MSRLLVCFTLVGFVHHAACGQSDVDVRAKATQTVGASSRQSFYSERVRSASHGQFARTATEAHVSSSPGRAMATSENRSNVLSPSKEDSPNDAPAKGLSIGSGLKATRGATNEKTRRGLGVAVPTMISSLSIVLGLFFLLVWFSRRAGNSVPKTLPKDVFEVLGKTNFVAKQQLYLVRVGNKLTLLSVSPHGTDALIEVCDPVEIDRIAGLCQASQPGSISSTFRDVLSQMNLEATQRRRA